MIVTLTPNTAVDFTLAVPEISVNATIRSSAQAWGMAGKAADAAWILGKLGLPVLALGFAAGAMGQRMEQMLHEHQVATDFTWVNGETRLNVVLVSTDGRGQSTFTSSGLHVSDAHQADLLRRYEAALDTASCIIIGGSLPDGVPPEFYTQTIGLARRRGIPVIFDASGPGLRAGVAACPSLIKPNQDELGDLIDKPPRTLPEIFEAARQLQKEFRTDVIATLGSEGAVAVLGDAAYQVLPCKLPIASTAGAGDGVLAGMALAVERKEPPENGLRYGFALAGAIVQTLATADFSIEDYEALLSQVIIQRL